MKRSILTTYACTLFFSLWLPTTTDLCRYERQNALWQIGGRLTRSEGLLTLEEHALIISEWAEDQDPCTRRAYLDWVKFFTISTSAPSDHPPELFPWKYKKH